MAKKPKDKDNERAKYVSYEVLDELMRVSDPKGWIGLAAIAVLVAFGVIWMFIGKLPSIVSGTGMLISLSGIEVITSSVNGIINRFDIKVGDMLKKGQPIAYISQFTLSNDITNAKHKIIEQRAANQEREEIRIRLEAQYNEELNALNTKIASLEKLLKSGMVLEKEALDTKLAITSVKKRLEDLKIEKTNDRNLLAALERDLRGLEERYERESVIVSPYNGRVIEIQENEGDVISPGENLLIMETSDNPSNLLQGIIYVSALEAQKIQPGMKTLINPSSIRPEEYGSMLGKVQYVSPYPATSKGMMNVLHNEEVVNQILKTGSQVEVHVELIGDESTYSKYQWTLKSGPPVMIQSGTLCNAKITVKERRPVEYIVPKIRQLLGLGVG